MYTYRLKRRLYMSVKSICNTKVVTIPKNMTLKQAAQKMNDFHVGSLVVTDNLNNKYVPTGIITDRDIALCMSSSDRPQDLTVEIVMQSHPITIKVSDGIYEAAKLMKENAVKRLPVVNKDGSLYGIVCADDILNLVGEEAYDLTRITNAQIQKERGIRTPLTQHFEI